MAHNIQASWHQPLNLVSGEKEGLTPLYIGRSKDLRARLEQHLKNSVRLMLAIQNAAAGNRFFLYCVCNTQSLSKLKTLESALIAHALGEGYELLQKQGTKGPTHTVTFVEHNTTSRKIVPRFVRLRAWTNRLAI